ESSRHAVTELLLLRPAASASHSFAPPWGARLRASIPQRLCHRDRRLVRARPLPQLRRLSGPLPPGTLVSDARSGLARAPNARSAAQADATCEPRGPEQESLAAVRSLACVA